MVRGPAFVPCSDSIPKPMHCILGVSVKETGRGRRSIRHMARQPLGPGGKERDAVGQAIAHFGRQRLRTVAHDGEPIAVRQIIQCPLPVETAKYCTTPTRQARFDFSGNAPNLRGGKCGHEECEWYSRFECCGPVEK